LTVKPALAAAASRRRFSMATGSSPRTGLWVKTIAFLPALAATSSWRSPPSITEDIRAGHLVGHSATATAAGPSNRTLPLDLGPANGRNRRVSLITVRPDESRLTEPTTAVQPWRREPLFVPQSGPLCERRPNGSAGGNRIPGNCARARKG